jgi:hypothetical protein
MDERQKILSQRVDAVATMVRLREANKGNIPSPRSKAGQEYAEAQARAKELTIRLMSKEAPEFQEATPTVGAPMPVSKEFEAETKDLLKQSKAATADINRAKRESYSLWQSLRGTLQPSEVNDISPDKEYKLLRAKAGTRGAVLDDIVADGKLDDFLPYANRHDSPNFDLTDAVEHVKEKLRTKNYMTEDTNRALEILGRHKEEIEKQIELHLGLKDINYELQFAADEQRAINQATETAPAQGEDAVAAPSEEQVAPEDAAKYLKDFVYNLGELEGMTNKAQVLLSSKLGKSGRDTLLMEAFGVTREQAHDINNRLDERQPKKLRNIDMQDAFDMFPGLRKMIDDAIQQAAPAETLELTQPTAEELRAKEAEAEKRAADEEKKAKEAEAKVKADKEVGEFTLTGSDRAADVAAAQGQKDIFAAPAEEELPFLDETNVPASEGRHPQVQAALMKLKEGKIDRATFDKYVNKHTPIRFVESGKLNPPTPVETMRKAIRGETNKVKLNTPIEEGKRVGLRMDLPSRDLKKGIAVVSIHEGKGNVNPKTGKPYTSAGNVFSYSSAAHIKNVEFAPRSQEKSMEMGIYPKKEPLQTAEGNWVNTKPDEIYKRANAAIDQDGWTQVGFDPGRHGYFYDRKTGRPVLSADEVYQVGQFMVAKNVKYGEPESFMYMKDTIEPLEKTETAAFKRWFGNSKVVDANGKPMVVYHTGRFDANEIVSGAEIWRRKGTKLPIGNEGIYFSSDPAYSAMYGGTREGGTMYPVYLSLQNPFIIKNKEQMSKLTKLKHFIFGERHALRNPTALGLDPRMDSMYITPEYKAELIKRGYDGIINEPYTEIVAFEPTQIKSAIGNIGTYDPTNPDIRKMNEKIERDATPEQIQRANGHAKDFAGDIIYQRDGVGLVRAFNRWNGRPVYIPVKDGTQASVDIDSFTGSGLTKAEIKELSEAKKKWVEAEEEKAKKEPFVRYNQDGVAFSQNVPADIAGVLGEWKKMLGIKSNVYITTVDDARANRLNLIGDFASVAGSTIDPNNAGVMQRLKNGDYFIAYTKKVSRVRMLETAAHEFGHIHEMEVFSKQDDATKSAIKDEFYSWLQQQKTATARDLVNTLRARASAKGTKVAEGMMASDLRAYWTMFEEWYADQVAKWATTQAKPLSVVEKFFAKLGAAMRAFYAKLRNGKYLPNQTFIQYMNRVTDAAVDSASMPANKEPFVSNQMEMQFMRDVIKETAQKVLQKRTPMDESAFAGLDADTIADVGKVFYAPNKTILDRMDSNKGRLFQWIAQKTVDEFRTAKQYSPMGHMQATLSKDTGGALENLLFHGHVTMNQGALDVVADKNRKGFIDSVKPLGKELDRWQIWMALSREANLPEAKRSPRLDALREKRDDFIKGDINGRPREEVYEQARKDVMALNRSVLNVALMNGLIDREAYQRFANDMFYIPFYRAMEDGQLESVRTASRLSNQEFSRMLKGDNDKPFGDLMENTLRNWSHILSASMKNLASNTILTDARDAGFVMPALKPGLEWKTDANGQNGKVVNSATGNVVGNGELVQTRVDADGQEKLVAMTESKKGATDLVHTQVDGVTTYHHIIDPLLLESVGKITELGPRGLAVDIMRPFKDLLRFGVTASPTFKAYNLIRESIQSAALSDLSGNLVKNVYSGLYDSGKDSPIYRSALAGGGVFNFGSVLEGDRSEAVKKLISRGVDAATILDTPEKVKHVFSTIWHKYEDLGNKAENANRIALYKQLMKPVSEGGKGYTHLEASFAARDLINFTAMGSSNAIRFVSATVPFFNARLQGLYKLGRDGVLPTTRVFYNSVTGKQLDLTDVQKAKAFTSVTGAVALASIALYMAYKDDEDFQKREQWDRDAFWWGKIPGTDIAIRVPKPFETGAIATLVERTVEQMMDKDVETKRFTDALSRMVWQTFSMNPVPQFVKPLVDIYANKNPFTSAPIETAGMERLSKQERRTDATSPIAIALGGVSNVMSKVTGESTELSPIQIDYMIRAYMGWLGGTIASTSAQAIKPFNGGVYPDLDYTKQISLGFAEKLPTAQSTYLTDFYQNNIKIQQAYADMRHYAELQQSDKVLEVLKEKQSEIMMSKFYDKTAKNLANIRQQILMISNPSFTGMTGEQKKEEIQRLKLLMSQVAQQTEEARKSLKELRGP